jgi:hypothetical protein
MKKAVKILSQTGIVPHRSGDGLSGPAPGGTTLYIFFFDTMT